jgi:hypothetical protein
MREAEMVENLDLFGWHFGNDVGADETVEATPLTVDQNLFRLPNVPFSVELLPGDVIPDYVAFPILFPVFHKARLPEREPLQRFPSPDRGIGRQWNGPNRGATAI